MQTSTMQINMNDSEVSVNKNIAMPLEVELQQEEFHHAISLVQKAVAKHPIQPVLNNIFLRSSQDPAKLILGATDMELAISVELDAEVLKEGEITVPAQKLQEIVTKLSKGKLRLQSDEANSFYIFSGRSKFEIKGMGSEEFPKESLLTELSNKGESIYLPLKEVRKGCELVNFASDKKEVNSILNGICLEIGNENNLEIASTDGSRLAYYKALNCVRDSAKDENDRQQRKSIIPFRTISELLRMISDLDEENIKCVFFGDNSILFESENRKIRSNLISGSYPKYQQLVPASYHQKAIVNREDFIAALERVAVLANEKSRVIKLFFEKIGILTVSANTPDLGEAQDQLDLEELEGEDFTIAFNVSFMIECLKNLDCEKVQLKMIESLKPIIVSPVVSTDSNNDGKKDNYLYLLMPVQIRN